MGAALLLCDMWDAHWCRTAAAGTARIARSAAITSERMRAAGGLVIHAPSNTMEFYADHPARQYVLGLKPAAATTAMADNRPPPPAGAPCPDRPTCPEPSAPPWPWKRQHPAIAIAREDAILDRGEELFAVIADRAVDRVFVAGVHTNRCVVDRPFAIRALVGARIECSLVGDLTEAMPPASTAASLDYVARHWCPIVHSCDVKP
jgi:nicotinamidase-related amidase